MRTPTLVLLFLLPTFPTPVFEELSLGTECEMRKIVLSSCQSSSGWYTLPPLGDPRFKTCDYLGEIGRKKEECQFSHQLILLTQGERIPAPYDLGAGQNLVGLSYPNTDTHSNSFRNSS